MPNFKKILVLIKTYIEPALIRYLLFLGEIIEI